MLLARASLAAPTGGRHAHALTPPNATTSTHLIAVTAAGVPAQAAPDGRRHTSWFRSLLKDGEQGGNCGGGVGGTGGGVRDGM